MISCMWDAMYAVALCQLPLPCSESSEAQSNMPCLTEDLQQLQQGRTGHRHTFFNKTAPSSMGAQMQLLPDRIGAVAWVVTHCLQHTPAAPRPACTSGSTSSAWRRLQQRDLLRPRLAQHGGLDAAAARRHHGAGTGRRRAAPEHHRQDPGLHRAGPQASRQPGQVQGGRHESSTAGRRAHTPLSPVSAGSKGAALTTHLRALAECMRRQPYRAAGMIVSRKPC